MRIVLAGVALLAIVWGGYWFVGARAVESNTKAWFAARNGGAITASHAGIDVGGFPNRFDLKVSAPLVYDSTSRSGWQAPEFKVYALSYRPNHLIAVWPDTQRLQLNGEMLDMSSDDLRASLVLRGGTALDIDRITLVGNAMELRSDRGWQAAAQTLRLASRKVGDESALHEIALELLDLSPDPAWRAGVDPRGLQPARIDGLRLDMRVAFDAPLNRHGAAGGTPPRPTAVDLRDLRLVWGELMLRGEGRLEFDGHGIPEGKITLEAENWRAMLDLAVAAEFVHPEAAETWSRGLQVLEDHGGREGVLEVPLHFSNGQMRLGALPLGPAPRLP